MALALSVPVMVYYQSSSRRPSLMCVDDDVYGLGLSSALLFLLHGRIGSGVQEISK